MRYGQTRSAHGQKQLSLTQIRHQHQLAVRRIETQVKKTQRSITNDDVKAGGDNKSGGSMQ